ncbi:TetR/AcrR family transcriptional regulator [Marinobacter persicus]|jgi:AcrR family transcriptional regulator|uniref:TetR family transcriptional regulator n=1 Tax=Marinobacter persicus TaxID=930118 RepID=A0A2S6G5P4_9GAMM|nr:TetR/AcrR family transcriptional regulator [Marinobacter persicus]PPK50375.1 TetR family transcriptional regulator [Marinobacter persicus]PPK54457.1 TetR family transcriptional regulator [Marinobacter persicus]PPK57584.1 TetR family transcriptional regulator [Marinobacter persicus]
MPVSAKRTYQSTELRQSTTIEAVVQLCAEQDPATLTTARIADEVGLSQGALFKHFPNKNRLWESVACWVSEQLTRQVFSAADEHQQADQALEAMFLAHVDFIVRHPGIPRLMLGELQKPGNGPAKSIIRQTLARYRKKVVELLNQGIQQRHIASGIDTEAAAVLYLGAIQGLVVQGMISGEINALQQTAPRIFRLYNASLQEIPDEPEK